MQADLKSKLKVYVETFNATDEEFYSQAIPNHAAYAFLAKQIPLLECPDQELETIYYFRWWVLRKHFKQTPQGHIITEFLPPVQWAGPYNSINCATCHHIREARWLTNSQTWVQEYLSFWLRGSGQALSYSMWLSAAVEEYCEAQGDFTIAQTFIDDLVCLYERWEDKALQPCGLFWSDDDRDGMEFSISGPGLRPTLNSYMYGDASAISRMAHRFGCETLSQTYGEKAKRLKEAMDRLLWDGDFYKTIPCEKGAYLDTNSRPKVSQEHNVRELLGYIPWCFHMPDADKKNAFAQLLDEQGFQAPLGLTTAERRHPRFQFANEHDCLWNGPAWPFATSQTLVAAANLLQHATPQGFTKNDYWYILKQYAHAHHRINEQGLSVPWIDENYDPFNGQWIARSILEKRGWKPETGGYERGKDYNHSLFCDLVLSGLLGIGSDESGQLAVHPLIPDDWSYFRVSNLFHAGKLHTITFDKTGAYYPKGLRIVQESK